MVIFLAGATGMIGARVAQALVAAGHSVVCGVRDPMAAAQRLRGCRLVHVDFAAARDVASWMPLLAGVDVVINAVGIFSDATGHDFRRLHTEAPVALFKAAVTAGVRRIVQISALGADASAQTAYHRSKLAADEALLALPVSSLIVQPSLVFAPEGRSTRFFAAWATLPVVPLPGSGAQRIQPVHIDDVVELIVAGALAAPDLDRPGATAGPPRRVPAVGREPMTLKDYLAVLRRVAGGPRGWVVPVPMALVRFATRLGALLPGSLMNADALAMLERGNVAPTERFERLVGRPPRALSDMPADPESFGTPARLTWLLPLLRASIAAVWIWTAIVSAGLYPRASSLELLARVGAPAALRPLLLYGAALLDLVLGVLSLAWPRRLGSRARLWVSQIALIVMYTALISWRLPEFWLHPYGPLSKNLPMIALLILLIQFDGGSAARPRRDAAGRSPPS
ncbi:SDR family oxidoreductase [Paraburkholderia phenoliruptrix]|uniref:SDR family oxidoreductase n=1 Tax=Paraburkholderia phenoliruptrix TaxID=252970 RepID=UPI00286A742E|nr:SDR family oxidoreductase [Paraburkholderia phenoliruptrix]